MAEDNPQGQGSTGGGDPQDQPGQQPGAGAPNPAGQGSPDEDAESYDKDRALRTIRSQRESERQLRQRLTDLEAQVKAHDAEKLTETERLHSKLSETELELTELRRERQELVLRHATVNEAAKLGIIDPEAAYRLLDVAEVEFDQAGRPSNLPALLKELVKAKPYLSRQPANGSADGGQGHGRQRDDVQPGLDRLRAAYEEQKR